MFLCNISVHINSTYYLQSLKLTSVQNLFFIMSLSLLIPIAFKHATKIIESPKLILAGDVGGTKANMMLCSLSSTGLETIKQTRYESKDYKSFNDILTNFLEGQSRPDNICLSVAGPVIDDKVKFTNLSWNIDSEEICNHIKGCRVAIINDLEATAYGLAALKKEELSVLYKGVVDAPGNIAILAAGTGLGEAGLYFDGTNFHPFATEGGHADFAPRSQRDIAVLNFLLNRHEHVSWERLLSGRGIITIWEYLAQIEKKESPAWLLQQMEGTDAAPVISKAATDGTCDVCVETVEIFNRYLAIEAANLVLKLKATGGLYLAGGIAPKLLPLLKPAVWEEVFSKSGRMKQLLDDVTVSVVLNEKAPLLGASYFASLNMD